MSEASESDGNACRKEAVLVAGAPDSCMDCQSPLCLRKQVINLALGNNETMLCLNCLAADSNQSGDQVLTGVKSYIAGRDCFFKEWLRYENVEFCPDRSGCLPDLCFDEADSGSRDVMEAL